MALTRTAAANKVTQWDDKFFAEYVRANQFNPYMGVDENSTIQIKENLTKKKGDKISIPLVTKLAGTGVRGNNKLQGNEEQLGNYAHLIEVFPVRNGVAVTEYDEQMTVIDLRKAPRSMLKFWAMETLRDDIITAFMSMGDDNAYLASQTLADSNYTTTATEGEKDTFLGNNLDRFLFGAAKSNTSTTDHSASLANIDGTNDILSPAIISLAKRMAKAASPAIRPIKTDKGGEWFILFAQSFAFRDLKNNSVMIAANRDGMERGKNNPLFIDGDLMWDGVIIREIEEIPVLENVGASGTTDVAPNFFCGAQALGVAWAKRTASRTNTEDYGFENGVAVSEMRGVSKLIYDNDSTGFDDIQHGMLTLYTAGVADT